MTPTLKIPTLKTPTLPAFFILLVAMLATLVSPPAIAGTLSAPDAHAAVQAGKLTLIDIRTAREWRQTRVAKDAVLIGMLHPGGPTGFVKEVLEKVGGDRTAPIALICRTGNRTSQVLSFLRQQGFTNVTHVAEGMAGSSAGPGWLARGLPTQSCGNC